MPCWPVHSTPGLGSPAGYGVGATMLRVSAGPFPPPEQLEGGGVRLSVRLPGLAVRDGGHTERWLSPRAAPVLSAHGSCEPHSGSRTWLPSPPQQPRFAGGWKVAQIVPVGVLRDDGAFLCWRGWRPGFPGEEVGTSEDPSRRAPGALSCPQKQPQASWGAGRSDGRWRLLYRGHRARSQCVSPGHFPLRS